MSLGRWARDPWGRHLGGNLLPVCITHNVLGCACLAIFEKTRACFIITKTVNDLHSLLGLKMFHDLFGTLLGDVQLFTFSDVRSLTYKWTKSIFTLAFMHF